MKYPRYFLAIDENFPEQSKLNIYNLLENEKEGYVPGKSKKSTVLDKQISFIKNIDEVFYQKENRYVVALYGTYLNEFIYMILTEFNFQIYWIDSKEDYKKILETTDILEDLKKLNESYYGLSESYENISDEISGKMKINIYSDKFTNLIYGKELSKIMSNTNSAVLEWYRVALRKGFPTRLDLES